MNDIKLIFLWNRVETGLKLIWSRDGSCVLSSTSSGFIKLWKCRGSVAMKPHKAVSAMPRMSISAQCREAVTGTILTIRGRKQSSKENFLTNNRKCYCRSCMQLLSRFNGSHVQMPTGTWISVPQSSVPQSLSSDKAALRLHCNPTVRNRALGLQ